MLWGKSILICPNALSNEQAALSQPKTTDAVEVLKKWRQHLTPSGGIWLLTAKRGQPGYVDQRELITAGQQAEVVDNKICSVSPTVSAMRFVIRKKDRRA